MRTVEELLMDMRSYLDDAEQHARSVSLPDHSAIQLVEALRCVHDILLTFALHEGHIRP